MTRYAVQETSAKSAKARGSYLRVHFKNTREVAASIAGKKLSKAVSFLRDVTDFKQVSWKFTGYYYHVWKIIGLAKQVALDSFIDTQTFIWTLNHLIKF